jgi:hypothetical protein
MEQPLEQPLADERLDEQAEEAYQISLARKAVFGLPKEDAIYAILSDFLILHQKPLRRFTIYPQMCLEWNPTDPQDRRAEVPDLGLGTLLPPDTTPFFKLRCGVEVKRASQSMLPLPPPGELIDDKDIKTAF